MKTFRILALALGLVALSTLSPAASRAADVPLPPPPGGTSLQPGAGARTYKLALMGGFLDQGGAASGSIQIDVGLVATPRNWNRFQLEWHLPVRLARPQWDGRLSRVVGRPFPLPSYAVDVGTTKDTVWVAEAVATARLILPVAPGFALHVEAGAGLSQTVQTHVEDEIYVGRTSTRKLVFAPALRGAIGLTYKATDRLELVLQPAVLGTRLGTDDSSFDSSFSALWGVSYRL